MANTNIIPLDVIFIQLASWLFELRCPCVYLFGCIHNVAIHNVAIHNVAIHNVAIHKVAIHNVAPIIRLQYIFYFF